MFLQRCIVFSNGLQIHYSHAIIGLRNEIYFKIILENNILKYNIRTLNRTTIVYSTDFKIEALAFYAQKR